MENLVVVTAVIAFFGAIGWALYFYERAKNEELMNEIQRLNDKVARIERNHSRKLDAMLTEICRSLANEERARVVIERVNEIFDRIEKEQADED